MNADQVERVVIDNLSDLAHNDKLVLDIYELADFSRGSTNRQNWLPGLDSNQQPSD